MLDHDFDPKHKVLPFGIFLPQYNELYLYFTPSCLTSDFIVGCLVDFWVSIQDRFPQVKTLLLNQAPYHSKYNPIERVWAVLEKHWNGSLLDTLTTVLKFAQTMTWHGRHPVVKFVKKTFATRHSI